MWLRYVISYCIDMCLSTDLHNISELVENSFCRQLHVCVLNEGEQTEVHRAEFLVLSADFGNRNCY